jgi:osmoprotectant transport system substrate-binding protein
VQVAVSRRGFASGMPVLLAARRARAEQPVVVASKIDTEGSLLGQLITQTLRARGLAVETRLQLGPTRIVRQALLSGAVDLCPDYTGGGASFFRLPDDPAWHDPAAAYALVRRLDLTQNSLIWLTPAPADNGWGIATRADMAQRLGLVSMADFGRLVASGGYLYLAASVEFVESRGALPAFERAYGFRLRQDQLLMLAGGDTSATLRAASEGLSGVNAAMAYGTDGALSALGMVLMDDPRRAQIVFQPAPVIRATVLAAQPNIGPWLEPVFSLLTRPVLRGLNAQIAAEGTDPADVARGFLKRSGLPA